MLCYLQVQINETSQDALSLSITLGNKTYLPLYMSLKHFSFRPVNTSISLHFFSYLLKISLACRSAFSSIRSHSSRGGMLMQSVTTTKFKT